MCIANLESDFDNTKIYQGKIKNSNNFFMAYQMNFESIGEDKSQRCIILPIASKKIVKFHDTSKYNLFLSEMQEQTEKFTFDYMEGVKAKKIYRGISSKLVNEKFEECGMYNVAAFTLKELKQYIKFDKIVIKKSLYKDFKRFLSNYTFIVAKFPSNKKMESQPFAVEYEPRLNILDNGETWMQYPTIDNETILSSGDIVHGGGIENKIVQVNHSLFFPNSIGLKVKFSQDVPNNLISNEIGFYAKHGKQINGNYVVNTNNGKLNRFSVNYIEYENKHFNLWDDLSTVDINSMVKSYDGW
jgi:hypothetical protein